MAPVGDPWTLTPEERSLVMAKNRSTRLTFAVLLLYFRENGSFPPEGYEAGIETIQRICLQIDMDPRLPLRKAIPAPRTVKRLRAEIRAKFGFREATLEDLRAILTKPNNMV